MDTDVIDSQVASRIYSLVYHQDREIASAAALFLHKRILRKVGMKSIEYIKELADFHIEAVVIDIITSLLAS